MELNRILKIPVLIFLLALAVRLAWIWSQSQALSWGDEGDYVTIANGLLRGDGYVSSSLRANPGYPVFLASVFGVCGESVLAARVGQCLLGALTCLLLYGIGTKLVNRTVGILAGMMLAFYPPHIYLAGVIYTETVVTMLCALAVFLAAQAMEQEPKPWWGVAAGVALGMASLTRATFAVYAPFVCVAWLYSARREWRRYIPLCVAFAIGIAGTVLPWTIRNYRVFHRVIPVSSGFQTLLWRGNTPLTRGGTEDRDLIWYCKEWKERLAELPEAEQRALVEQYAAVDARIQKRKAELGDDYLASDEVLGPIAVGYVTANPGRTVCLALAKLKTLYTAFTKTQSQNVHTTRRNEFIAALSFYPVLILAGVGVILGFRLRHRLALIELLVVSVSLIYALLVTATRYRLPLDPYLILLAAVALNWIINRSGRRLVQELATISKLSTPIPRSGSGQ